jgi:hypothetical protein
MPGLCKCFHLQYNNSSSHGDRRAVYKRDTSYLEIHFSPLHSMSTNCFPIRLCNKNTHLSNNKNTYYTCTIKHTYFGIVRPHFHSSVGIATRYELEGRGIESRWGRNLQHPSRQALGPIQPPVQWVQGHSRG